MVDRNYSKETIAFEACRGTQEGFINALLVWINKPHVVNRRLCGSKLELAETVSRTRVNNFYINSKLKASGFETNVDCLNGVIFGENAKQETASFEELDLTQSSCIRQENSDLSQLIGCLQDGEVLVLVRQMLPKQPERHPNIPELILLGDLNNTLIVFLK